ncbi:hypothetical protein RB600_008947 [Gaeumannomyces tritici]
MASPPSDHAKRFLNYPEPVQGPVVPYVDAPRKNPVLTGRFLVLCAVLYVLSLHPPGCILLGNTAHADPRRMEWLRFVREYAWRNANFGALRSIRRMIEDYEPLYEPTIVPLPDPDAGDAQEAPLEFGPQPPAAAKYVAERYYSAADYRALYLAGQMTPTDVAKAILPLIRRDTEPKGRHSLAWFDVKVDIVLRQAAESTARYREGRSLGPLDGVPTAVKDEYDMDGYITCHGSLNDYTSAQLEDGSNTNWCVRMVERAGCVVLGKLSMNEFGLDTTGNNPVWGTPPNPYNKDYYTGGSSSGCGYAVAAGLVPFSLGGDGGGSIRVPSSLCGVFGLKPTHGRLSFRPTQNHCSTCAVLGPIASDVRSLAAVYSVIGQPHPTSPFPPLRSGPSMLSWPASRPKILAVPERWFSRASPAVQLLCRALIQRLVQERGYRIVSVDIPFLNEGQIAHALVVLADGTSLLPDTSNLTAANRVLLSLGSVTSAVDLLLAHKLRRLLVNHLADLWTRQHPGMLLLTPTTACPGWPVRNRSAEMNYGLNDGDTTLTSMQFVWMANFCGLPAITVPAGFVSPVVVDGATVAKAAEPVQVGEDVAGKVPIGLMAMGEWGAEEQLLGFGLDAEEVGADLRCRPPVWEDVIELAKRS